MKIFSLFQLALIAIYTMSCCPPNAEPYLAPDYATVGEIVTLPSGLNIYSTGKVSDLSSRAVIILPDVFGWNSGRTRNIADLFASHGYLAVVPQLLAPGLDGGTDGDGMILIYTSRLVFVHSATFFQQYSSFRLQRLVSWFQHNCGKRALHGLDCDLRLERYGNL